MTLKFRGIPTAEGEDLNEILKKMSAVIGFDYDEKMVNKCYRYKGNALKPGNIMIRFVRNIDMQSFMDKRRKKKNLNSRDLGFMEGNALPIYVNNSLTSEKRKLLNAAKQLKQEKMYTFLWVRNGRIFMRKNPGDRFVVVETFEDLKKLA